MGLTYCEACNATEGRTREMTAAEALVAGYVKGDGVTICGECETLEDTLRRVPEHDDGDER